MEAHECFEENGCLCSPETDSPNENCPHHGRGIWPPRCCLCGRFMKWPKPIMVEIPFNPDDPFSTPEDY